MIGLCEDFCNTLLWDYCADSPSILYNSNSESDRTRTCFGVISGDPYWYPRFVSALSGFVRPAYRISCQLISDINILLKTAILSSPFSTGIFGFAYFALPERSSLPLSIENLCSPAKILYTLGIWYSPDSSKPLPHHVRQLETQNMQLTSGAVH